MVLADLADKVGGEEVSVTAIIPAGFCPAHYDLRPSDLLAVARAKLVLYHGFEPWLETLLSNVNPDAHVVALKGPWNTPEPMSEKARAISVEGGVLRLPGGGVRRRGASPGGGAQGQGEGA